MSVSLNEVSRSEVKDIADFCIKSLFWVYILYIWSHLTHPLLKEYLHVSQVAIFIISLKVKFSGPLWCENFVFFVKTGLSKSVKSASMSQGVIAIILFLSKYSAKFVISVPFNPLFFGGGVLSRAHWDNKLVDHHLKNIYTLSKFVNIDLSSDDIKIQIHVVY